MLKTRLFLTSASLALFLAVPAYADNVRVLASFSILEDLAKNVGGDRVEINSLVSRNADAHAYEPDPQDAVLMSGADVVLVNGLGFEGFLERLVVSSGTKATIVEVSKGISAIERGDEDEGHHDHAHDDAHKSKHHHEHKHKHDDHDHGAYDPHAWQSVKNVVTYVANIKDALCAADKEGCDTYTANAKAYTVKLQELDNEIRDTISAWPEGKRTVITSHAAFGYFAKEYGVKFLAPEGIATHSEASAKDVAALIDQIKHDKVSAVFVENISNGRVMEQIARETGAKIGGSLYSDALTYDKGAAPDYISLMRANLKTLNNALAQ